jgi:hypothetical protein
MVVHLIGKPRVSALVDAGHLRQIHDIAGLREHQHRTLRPREVRELCGCQPQKLNLGG